MMTTKKERIEITVRRLRESACKLQNYVDMDAVSECNIDMSQWSLHDCADSLGEYEEE